MSILILILVTVTTLMISFVFVFILIIIIIVIIIIIIIIHIITTIIIMLLLPFHHIFVVIPLILDIKIMECRSRVLSASQIVGSAPEGVYNVEADSGKEGAVQIHKGWQGQSITTGSEGKPLLQKKKGSVEFDKATKQTKRTLRN